MFVLLIMSIHKIALFLGRVACVLVCVAPVLEVLGLLLGAAALLFLCCSL